MSCSSKNHCVYYTQLVEFNQINCIINAFYIHLSSIYAYLFMVCVNIIIGSWILMSIRYLSNIRPEWQSHSGRFLFLRNSLYFNMLCNLYKVRQVLLLYHSMKMKATKENAACR